MPLKNLKICGITSAATAEYCAAIGVGALGAIFYPPSPRNLTAQKAREIFINVPDKIARVGVFVDQPLNEVLAIAEQARLTTLQLHGCELPQTALELARHGYRVVKVLKQTGVELMRAAARLPATIGIMVECGAGILPGGNGTSWDWAAAAPLAEQRRYALAGGLTPANIVTAMRLSAATACDLSSGVEQVPGIKNHAAIAAVAQALKEARLTTTPPCFWQNNHG